MVVSPSSLGHGGVDCWVAALSVHPIVTVGTVWQ